MRRTEGEEVGVDEGKKIWLGCKINKYFDLRLKIISKYVYYL